MKLRWIMLALTALIFTLAAGLPVTSDMKETKGEYENTKAQWYVKEGYALLLEQITYEGWKVTTNEQGEKDIKFKWANQFTGESFWGDKLGNSDQDLVDSLSLFIGDENPPITEKEAKKFFDKIQKYQILGDLRLRYDKNYDNFKEQLKVLSKYEIIPYKKEEEFLRNFEPLEIWKNRIIDVYDSLQY